MSRAVAGLAALVLVLTWSWCTLADSAQPGPGTQDPSGKAQVDKPSGTGGQQAKEPEPPAPEQPAEATPKEKDPWDEPTAEDLVDELRRQRPETEIVRPERTLDEMPSESTPSGGGQLLPEGTMIPRRLGRVVRDGTWWTFVFESDHPEHPEPPIRLLPNNYLEVMTRMARTIPTGLVFEVSGEVTEFEGYNYLLVRSCVRRQDSGNLTK